MCIIIYSINTLKFRKALGNANVLKIIYRSRETRKWSKDRAYNDSFGAFELISEIIFLEPVPTFNIINAYCIIWHKSKRTSTVNFERYLSRNSHAS